jgi:hypothetical protein
MAQTKRIGDTHLHKKIKELSKEIDNFDECINKLPIDCTKSKFKEAEEHIENIILISEKINKRA